MKKYGRLPGGGTKVKPSSCPEPPNPKPRINLAQIAATYNEAEIQKLHNFLMKNYQGKLTGKKSPVDVAIEIMEGEKMMGKKICPLLSKCFETEISPGRNYVALHEEKCRQDNCGFWSDATKECAISSMGTIGLIIRDAHTGNQL